MSWYILQFVVPLLLAFLLGVVVGWWFFRSMWRKTHYTESETITRLTRDHNSALAAKDTEIKRLAAKASSNSTTVIEKKVTATPVVTEATVTDKEPTTKSASTKVTDKTISEGDDLERIEGIGPRISTALRSAGIGTYEKLAQADVATLQSALEASGLRFAPSLPTWSRQARFLADADEDGFQALREQLVSGGSDKSRRN